MKSGAVQYPLECIVFYMDVVSVFVFEMLQTTKYQLRLSHLRNDVVSTSMAGSKQSVAEELLRLCRPVLWLGSV